MFSILILKKGVCEDNQIWLYSQKICIRKPKNSLYSESCSTDSDCVANLNLICNNGISLCNCPLSLNIGKCDCPRTSNNEFYWNGTHCVQTKLFLDPCIDSYECTSDSLLFCDNNICKIIEY